MKERVLRYIIRRVNERSKDSNVFTDMMLFEEIKESNPEVDMKEVRQAIAELVSEGTLELGQTINHNYFII